MSTYDIDGRHDDDGMNVGDVERWLSILAGAGLLALATRQRRAAALAAGTLGAGLIVRGLGGRCPVYRASRINRRHGARHGDTYGDCYSDRYSDRYSDTREALGGSRGLHVKTTTTIARPVETVYRFWRDLSNLPRGMQHLESVTPLGNGRSHWVVRGPAGLRVEWDAEIIHEEENRVIGWRSLDPSDVVSAGSVTFRPVGAAESGAGRSATEVTVHLQYEPPAGRVGALVAKLFGEEPSQQIADDLRRVKEILEAGDASALKGASTSEGRSNGFDVAADHPAWPESPAPTPGDASGRSGVEA